jgi:hypothetical protein
MWKDNNFLTAFVVIEILFLIFFGLDIYYQIALAIFLYQFLSMLFKIGDSFPIRNLIGTVYSINYLLSPVLMYSWLNDYTIVWYRMKGTADDYFGYAIPAMLCLIVGLNLGKTQKSEYINVAKVKEIIAQFPRLPLHLIIVGFIADFTRPFIPSELVMIATALSNLKYVGFFLHLLSGAKLNYYYLVFSYGFLTLQSLLSSMFNDFLNMLFFLGIFLALRYRPKFSAKVLAVVGGLAIVSFIQIIKFPLRERVSDVSGIGVVNDAIKEGVDVDQKKGMDEKVANVVFRACQGWITSNVIVNYKQNGFVLQDGGHSNIIFQSALLPRFFVPNKYALGDPELFNKYSGHFVQEGTSMALGILSDAFIDFGYNGIFIVLVWGLIFNFFIRIYSAMEKKYALATIFSSACFFYAIRPDTDSFGALGSLIKITFIIFIFLALLNKFYFTKKLKFKSNSLIKV